MATKTKGSATAGEGVSSKAKPTGAVSKAVKSTKAKHPLIEETKKHYVIGQGIRPKADLTKYVKWPSYIQLQRKRAILLKRLKVPPALNQFRYPASKTEAAQLFKLLAKYRPETREAKKARLLAEAKDREAGKEPSVKKPVTMIRGLNHVTWAVENKKAKLVVISHDVDPIDLVVFLPTLCRKMGVPYCIVKSKSRLGALTHRKTTATVALVDVKKEDQNTLDQLIKSFASDFIDNVEVRRRWGN